ncbi:hypothetical protein FHS31_001433 [Sphingomonas vulcanisoli]|uniref:Cytochrome c oxidase subunit IV bacterial aa3 type domain-containing protein n=1 Tax=Sphingomonas vulcanisoli TaxID=1658060 RepID=A0ABX0TQL4_9SPHN|nr:aa3-type cytochrome c oxidase subunit IV [Sphingomonas vulcanisoli]NIJ07823.1 hypothetical protein [Sphingomonas vulcanisoli]
MADGAKMDMPAHERSYASFIAMARWGAIAVAIIAAIVILIIAR